MRGHCVTASLGDRRGGEVWWLVSRFFVAGPPQNDIRVEGGVPSPQPSPRTEEWEEWDDE